MLKMAVTLTLTQELLGTASANPKLYGDFIQSKRPEDAATDDETATLPPVEEEIAKNTTVFHRDTDGRPFLYDYTIKGFFKDACAMLRRSDDDAPLSKKLKAFKKEIDGLIFVEPRQIVLELPDDGDKMGICERPLRAQTALGERIALARSETVPVATKLTFTILALKNLEGEIREWLAYGVFRGLGQWRNSGKGRFTYEAHGVE
jgi:hypothetical protein